MPTLIGWAGASGTIGRQAWWLFGILFLWQFPHFLAIALMYREDYARAGYRMLPRFDLDSRFTRAVVFTCTLLLVFATLLATGSSGGVAYPAAMGLAGAFMLYPVSRLLRSTATGLASRVLHASVLYLPAVLAVMMVGKS